MNYQKIAYSPSRVTQKEPLITKLPNLYGAF